MFDIRPLSLPCAYLIVYQDTKLPELSGDGDVANRKSKIEGEQEMDLCLAT